jgi:hypothetical protein
VRHGRVAAREHVDSIGQNLVKCDRVIKRALLEPYLPINGYIAHNAYFGNGENLRLSEIIGENQRL